jgi:hypothetical protein
MKLNIGEIESLFNDKQFNNIDKNLLLLPDDLKKNIYIEYFEPIIEAHKLCNQLISLLTSQSSRQLDKDPIVPILTLVLDNKLAIEYLNENYFFVDDYNNKKQNIFKKLYDQIIINNKKNFIHYDLVDDFALSWLYYMYH